MEVDEIRGRLRLRRKELGQLRIAVLAGGGSNEREVSLTSGRAVAAALNADGYSVDLAELHPDDLTLALHSTEQVVPLSPANDTKRNVVLHNLYKRVPALQHLRSQQLIFTTLHGASGENGTWQGAFELMDVPFVSAGVKGSVLAMDKLVSKRLFTSLSIPTPRYWVERLGATCRQDVTTDLSHLVAKPVAEGSSVGIAIVENNDAGWDRISVLVAEFGTMIIEERIKGRELTAGIIGSEHDAMALPLVEIQPQHGFYDYPAKYTKGGSEYICPAQVDKALAERIQEHALHIFYEFGLSPYARMDCILDDAGVPWFLEANTIPGFTSLSLLPMAAQAAGIEFTELIEMLMLLALERWERVRQGGDDDA